MVIASEHGATSDFERYVPLVSPGGFMVGDGFLESGAGVSFAVFKAPDPTRDHPSERL